MNLFSTISFRIQGTLTTVSLLIGTVLAWYALGAVRWDVFLRQPESPSARLLRLLFALLIGGGVAGFILNYTSGAAMMRT